MSRQVKASYNLMKPFIFVRDMWATCNKQRTVSKLNSAAVIPTAFQMKILQCYVFNAQECNYI